MRNSRIIVATFLMVFAAAALWPAHARADWNPGEPAKWVQPPDPTGFDVNATWKGQYPYVKILADDWKCTSQDPITDIHIWGSWLNNIVDNQNIQFKLSIHRDVPAGVDSTYSHPGPEVREYLFGPGQGFTARPDPNVPQGQTERFYDPNTNQIIGTDNQIWQYNFENLPDPFVQEGTTSNPVIYWLDVQACLPPTDEAVFGWKTTSAPHQLDDAVYGDTQVWAGPLIGPAPGPPFWLPMTYPAATSFHPAGESMDLAFVITSVPEPGVLALSGLVGLALLIRRK